MWLPARNGNRRTAVRPTTMDRWTASVRIRLRHGSSRTIHHNHRTSAGVTTTLIRQASASRAVTAHALRVELRTTSRPAATRASAPARGAAVSASTWAPPTVWTTTTGLRATIAAANAARSGRTLTAAIDVKAAAAPIATAAVSLNARMVASGDRGHVRTIEALKSVKSGP